jgi:ABC-type multidrug transport system fused ATPase/permease subunit
MLEYRSLFAFVPQEVILFSGTIEENIQYGRLDATAEEIHQAAIQGHAMEFIERFPDGMKTVIGERGIRLSGGQRQRLAISRAILNDPLILILDEATSNLDSESEGYVQDALRNLMKGRTSLVIAHRLSTIQNADKIFVLNDGEIEETGSHLDLIENDGLYSHLVALQLSKN